MIRMVGCPDCEAITSGDCGKHGPRLFTADGKPVEQSRICPRCGSLPSFRVASAGFGYPHDVCKVCGFEFTEWTCR